MYLYQARISAGCLFETHLSVLDLCHTLLGRSVLGKGHWQLPTHLFDCFLCFWNPVLTRHWSTKITFGLQPVHCSETLSQNASLDFHEDAIHSAIPPQSNASLNVKESSISLKISVTVWHSKNTGTPCQQWDKTDAPMPARACAECVQHRAHLCPPSSHSSRAEGGVLCARASSGILPHSTQLCSWDVLERSGSGSKEKHFSSQSTPFFFQDAFVKTRHNIQAGESLSLPSAELTDPGKGTAPCPAASPARTLWLWHTECYKGTQREQKKGMQRPSAFSCAVQYLTGSLCACYCGFLRFFAVGKNEAGVTNFFTRSFHWSVMHLH